MKAHLHINTKMRQDLEKYAQKRVEELQGDLLTRDTYIWCLSMIQAGLSARTVKRVMACVPMVSEKYSSYKTDKMADDFARLTLEYAGVETPETVNKT